MFWIYRLDRHDEHGAVRHHAVLCQPLHLPLANRDERLLHGLLARLRHIEGASQRVQEDTMRFSTTMEGLGVSLIDSAMTLIAFLPLLAALSTHVKVLPLVGEVPYSLVVAAVTWSIFGTVLLMVAGIKLPGLEFKNQRVEAAYRKELVYGEDHVRAGSAADSRRAILPCSAQLFQAVLPLRLLQRRAVRISAGRRHFRQPDLDPDHCGRGDNTWASGSRLRPPSVRSVRHSNILSTPGRRSSS